MTHKEIADRLRKIHDGEDGYDGPVTQEIARLANELDPPKPGPGTVVWWRYKHNHAFGWQLGEALDYGVDEFGKEGGVPWESIEYKPARISLPDTVKPAYSIGDTGPEGGIIAHDYGDGRYLEVVKEDTPELMNWYEAVDWCNTLGDGWRLPTKEEMNLLWKNKNIIGGFASYYYWSSSEYSSSLVWFQLFDRGSQYLSDKEDNGRVRAVRVFTVEEMER